MLLTLEIAAGIVIGAALLGCCWVGLVLLVIWYVDGRPAP